MLVMLPDETQGFWGSRDFARNHSTKFSEKKKSTDFFLKKSFLANRPKRVLPKFRRDPAEVRGVDGRSKFKK